MYLLGTADECDIVFTDRQMQPQHARLYVEETGIRIENQDGMVFTLQEEDYQGELALGTLLRAGNTWFVVEDAEAPWPDMDEIFSAMKPPKLMNKAAYPDEEEIEPEFGEETLKDEEDMTAIAEDEVQVNNEVAAPHPHSPSMFSRHSLQRLGGRILTVLFLLGIVSTCIFLAFKGGSPTKPTIPTQSLTQKNIRQVEQLLQNLHLKQRVNVTESKLGKIVISGYVANSQDMSTLLEGLAKLNIKAEFRLFDEAKILNEVSHVLLNMKAPIKAISLGMGRIQLVGAAASYDDVDSLLQKLNTSIDGLRGIDSEILVGDNLTAKLRQMIVDQGLSGKVALAINQGEAIVNGALDMREMAQWEQLMAQFVATYGNILPIRASFPPTATMLPFKVISAFSGEMPFIVTDQGQKVMLGGHIKGYTLVNITEQEIVFDGPRKVQIQR